MWLVHPFASPFLAVGTQVTVLEQETLDSEGIGLGRTLRGRHASHRARVCVYGRRRKDKRQLAKQLVPICRQAYSLDDRSWALLAARGMIDV